MLGVGRECGWRTKDREGEITDAVRRRSEARDGKSVRERSAGARCQVRVRVRVQVSQQPSRNKGGTYAL